MMVILDAIEGTIGWLLGSGASATAVAILLVVVLYGRRAMKLGGVAASWFQTALVTLAIIAGLLAVGVFELDLSTLLDLLNAGGEFVGGVVR